MTEYRGVRVIHSCLIFVGSEKAFDHEKRLANIVKKCSGFGLSTLHFPANFCHETQKAEAKESTKGFFLSGTGTNDRFRPRAGQTGKDRGLGAIGRPVRPNQQRQSPQG